MSVDAISVGVQSDNTVNLDIDLGESDGGWSFHNLSLDQADFLYEELGNALSRVKARAAKQATASATQEPVEGSHVEEPQNPVEGSQA